MGNQPTNTDDDDDDDQKPQRVFIHYVLGKMILLFFLCHPGTLATCDGQAYLRNRYANRDVVTTESELVSRGHGEQSEVEAEQPKPNRTAYKQQQVYRI